MTKVELDSIERALADLKAGKAVVVVDDEHRENEGDICMAAEKVTPAAINFMAKYARGLICLALTEERIAGLGLPMMVTENRAPLGTAFTVSVDARHGVKAVDEEILKLLDRSAVTFQAVLTKVDKINRTEREAVIEQVKGALGKHPAAYPEIVVTSSEKGEGIETLRALIATME